MSETGAIFGLPLFLPSHAVSYFRKIMRRILLALLLALASGCEQAPVEPAEPPVTTGSLAADFNGMGEVYSGKAYFDTVRNSLRINAERGWSLNRYDWSITIEGVNVRRLVAPAVIDSATAGAKVRLSHSHKVGLSGYSNYSGSTDSTATASVSALTR